MNRVVLVGRITRDPELRTSPSGVSFVAFSIAVNRTNVNANGELMVRECVYKKNLMKPSTIKLLDASLNYWRSRGVEDWGIVLDAQKNSDER